MNKIIIGFCRSFRISENPNSLIKKGITMECSHPALMLKTFAPISPSVQQTVTKAIRFGYRVQDKPKHLNL